MFASKRLRAGRCEWFDLSEDDINKISEIVCAEKEEIIDL
jgi:hypothetical protein